MARITKSLVENGPTAKTKLALNSDTSYDRLVIYVQWMVENGLAKENDGHISLTENGVSTYNNLVEWIVKYVGKLRFPRQR